MNSGKWHAAFFRAYMFKIHNMFNNENKVPPCGQFDVFSFSREQSCVRMQVINHESRLAASGVCRLLGTAGLRHAVCNLAGKEVHDGAL